MEFIATPSSIVTQTLTSNDYIQMVIAFVTFLAVLVALFGERLWKWKDRPQIDVYFDPSDTDEHVARMQKALGELASRFPQVVDKIRWIVIDDIAHASGFGDPESYPLNGDAMPQWHAFRYLPRGMELTPHRVETTSNFEGTFVHEMTH